MKINNITFCMVSLFCVSCSQKTIKPDLARLYKTSYISYETPSPVILIHGIMGSKLRDKSNYRELWF